MRLRCGTPASYSVIDSIIDAIENPVFAGGIEIEVAQESRRTIEPKVVPVTLVIMRWPDETTRFLGYWLPPSVSHMPHVENCNDAIGRPTPDKAPWMTARGMPSDENQLAINLDGQFMISVGTCISTLLAYSQRRSPTEHTHTALWAMVTEQGEREGRHHALRCFPSLSPCTLSPILPARQFAACGAAFPSVSRVTSHSRPASRAGETRI